LADSQEAAMHRLNAQNGQCQNQIVYDISAKPIRLPFPGLLCLRDYTEDVIGRSRHSSGPARKIPEETVFSTNRFRLEGAAMTRSKEEKIRRAGNLRGSRCEQWISSQGLD
jgi:hypothetical protein